MKAIILEQAGGVENLIYTDIEQPTPNDNEILVDVKAISVNPVDYKTRAIAPVIDMIYGDKRPVILGWDIAGTVSAVGSNASKFNVGDRVFGMVNFPGQGDAYAEMVAALEDHFAKVPDSISFDEAAATTLAALTALQVLETRVNERDRVLIHAGAGGVGHYAIQLAKNQGAHVITTASAKNSDFVLSLGADEHIDYRTQPFEEAVSEVDFVLDGIGGETLIKSMKVVKDGGIIISLPAGDFPEEVLEEAKRRNVDVAFILVKSSGEDMQKLAGMLADGSLRAHISKTFSFNEMREAHEALETGRTVGKIVVRV